MAEKKPFQNKPELPHEVLRPPPRRKKSLKKSRIEAEKAMYKRLNRSDADPMNMNQIDSGKLQTNDQYPINSAEKTPEVVFTEEALRKPDESRDTDDDNNSSSLIDSECEKQIPVEPEPTNEVHLSESKVREQQESPMDTKITAKPSPSMDENRNTLDLEECNHMGNKSTSPSSYHQNSAISYENEGSQICSQQSQGIINSLDSTSVDKGKRTFENDDVDSFCWVFKDNTSTSCQIGEEILQPDSQSAVEPSNAAKDVDIGKGISKQTETKDGNSANNYDNLESSVVLDEAVLSNESKPSSLPGCGEISIENCEPKSTNDISPEIITNCMSIDSVAALVNSNLDKKREISKQCQLDQTDSSAGDETIASESTSDVFVIDSNLHTNESLDHSSARAYEHTKDDEMHNEMLRLTPNDSINKSLTNEENNKMFSSSSSHSHTHREKENIGENNSTNLNSQDSELNTINEITITKAAKTKAMPKNSSAIKGKLAKQGSAAPYEHFGDSLSSMEEYELWEQENICSDTDSEIFYSDDSSSSCGEGFYNIEQNESLWGHNIDAEEGDSLSRSPTGEATIDEILSVFPSTEYLSVADNKEASNLNVGNNCNSSHGDKDRKKHTLNDLELSEDRANSLRHKIGSFKVIQKLDQKVDADVVKEAAVAMPTNSYKHTPTVDINTEEAEKAIQALHKNYLKHVSRDSKSKRKKSTESEGESSVYFSRVTTVQQDSGSDSPRTDIRLEISRPRSVYGEPRLRSLSTGDLNDFHSGIGERKSTLPFSAKSWKVENSKRLVNLHGDLKCIIGSLGCLEISRDRRDSGSPMFKHEHGKATGLDMVSEAGKGDVVGGIKNSAEPCQTETNSEDVFEETSLTLTDISTLESSTTSSFELSSTLNSAVTSRPLSAVQEEASSIPSSNRTSSASSPEKSQGDQQSDNKNNTPETVGLQEEIKPLLTSTPKRPKSLELSSSVNVFEECSLNSSQNDKDETDSSAPESFKSPTKNCEKNSSGEVETRKIKMSKGRRPFSAFEPGNIPTSPTEAVVKLREFRSIGDSDSLDAGVPDNDTVEVGVEVIEEEATPQRPPRKKPPLTPSASFIIPSREKPVKRVKKNRTEKSFRQTLSDAEWLKVRLSMAKPQLELMHDGPVTLVTDALPASIPNFPTHKRAQIALELYTTERTYVRGLETVIELFRTPLERYLDSKEMETMFSNINAIFLLNKDVLFSLCERVTHWKDEQMIGDIFVEMAPRFKIYAAYCTNYDAAETLIKQKIKRKKEFEGFLNSCYNDPICQPGLTLQAYLITVVQRIPRYLLLLRDLAKCTPADHVDSKTIKEGLQKMNNIAEYINNQLQAVQGQRAMTELRSRVIGIKAFETPGRSLIKEGEVYLMSTKKTYKCLLFNDMIVFAARNVNKHSEVELTLELKTLWVCDLDDNDPQTRKEDALELYTPERSYTMYSGSRNEKKLWLQKLKTAIAIQLLGEEATESSEISSRKTAFTFKDGRIYCGCFVDSKTHGHGVLAWPNRTRYVGNFEDGERNGIGELTYNSGEKYKGEWLDDKQHGVGTLTYPNDDVYCGEWKEGKMHGKGLITFSNHDKIDGSFVDSEVCGWAKLECTNGMRYEGTWKHSKKHGKGKLIKPNCDTYEGQFQNDRIHGRGKMVYAKTKATYDGQWENNQRHGSGSYSIPNGAHYEGEWSSDHIQGRGKMVYSNGEVYEGSWFRDMRFGKGLFKSHEGIYEGHFEYNLRHKYGLMDYKDGSKYEGEWQNDQREGQGEMIYADSGIYEGSWFHNLRHGRGKMTYPNGATYEGNWDLDSPHGSDGVYFDQASNYSYAGEWVHGRKEGRGVERTTSGTYDGDFKANVRHGKGVETLKGGIVFEGKWRDNRKVGEGQRRTRWGSTETTEIQQWKEGQLLNKDESVAPDLPFLQRH